MEKIIIKVLDFTEYPGPRYKNQGNSSGELFYELVLSPAFLKVLAKIDEGNTTKLVLDLDGTAGYASSFLDECVGNLVYDNGASSVNDILEIISKEEPDWIDVIFKETIPQWEQKRINGVPRKLV